MVDYHRFEKQYHASFLRIWKSKLCEHDKKGLEQFLKNCKSEGMGFARLRKLAETLIRLGETLPIPFNKAKEQDLRNLVMKYEEENYSFWTKHDIKVIIKQYYKWQNKGQYPKIVHWINTTIPHKQKMQQIKDTDLITEEELQKVIDTTDHPRNKAILAIISESGARIGEIGNLTINQINIDPNGAIINVNGKTGPRRIRIITSTPYLTTWINNHPDKKNPNAPLWINIGSKGHHHMMAYESIRKIIQKAFKKSGIKKRCNPYIFRHTRASQLAHHLTEFQMNHYFGWVQGSEMPSIYVHISGKDLDEHILKIHGMKPGEPPNLIKPQNRMCQRCKEINTPNALYCTKCAEIVDPTLAIKTKIENSQEQQSTIKSPFLEWLQTDPELQNVLKKKLAEFKQNTIDKQDTKTFS
ncbi:site-specific integrase [Candidatus Woesearchaeota archaeon]|nr:site-specific integrase [Candidatus Woesearchaeota archaeon]